MSDLDKLIRFAAVGNELSFSRAAKLIQGFETFTFHQKNLTFNTRGPLAIATEVHAVAEPGGMMITFSFGDAVVDKAEQA